MDIPTLWSWPKIFEEGKKKWRSSPLPPPPPALRPLLFTGLPRHRSWHACYVNPSPLEKILRTPLVGLNHFFSWYRCPFKIHHACMIHLFQPLLPNSTCLLVLSVPSTRGPTSFRKQSRPVLKSRSRFCKQLLIPSTPAKTSFHMQIRSVPSNSICAPNEIDITFTNLLLMTSPWKWY